MEIYDKVAQIIAAQVRMDPSEISESSAVMDDLGADSLDVVEILMSFEDEFDVTVPDEVVPTLKTVGDIVNYISENA